MPRYFRREICFLSLIRPEAGKTGSIRQTWGVMRSFPDDYDGASISAMWSCSSWR